MDNPVERSRSRSPTTHGSRQEHAPESAQESVIITPGEPQPSPVGDETSSDGEVSSPAADSRSGSLGQPQPSPVLHSLNSQSTIELNPQLEDEAVPEPSPRARIMSPAERIQPVLHHRFSRTLQPQPVLPHRTHLTIRGMEGALQNLSDAVSHFRAGMSRNAVGFGLDYAYVSGPNSMFNQHIEDMFQQTARHFEMLSRLHRESQDTTIPTAFLETTVWRIEQELGDRFWRNAAQLSSSDA